MSFLTQEQIESFKTNGFLAIPNFLPTTGDHSVEVLRKRCDEIVEGLDFSQSTTVFSTDEDKHAADDYFLTSGDKIRYFWEEKARKEGKLTVDPKKAINKIGHNLHDLEPEFEAVSYDKRVGQIARDLGQQKPVCCQSMYIFKQPFIGGAVGEH
jgi:phytanoyl-CoA hydroxylase